MPAGTKEPNAIKLFVGQIPKSYDENDLRELFEPFGEIYRLNLLQDKATRQHKGCAFLVYYDNESAKRAQAEMHESRTLAGARHPIQVKPAASEGNVDERTLYVGMLSRKLDENAVREMFLQFGPIEYLHILKNPDGKSKGCAFIKFETRLQAQNAIKAMHNSETMEGCSYPIVVKIADNDKDKLAKRGGLDAAQTSTVQASQIGITPQGTLYYPQVLPQQIAGIPQIVGGAPTVIASPIIGGHAGQQYAIQQPIQMIGQTIGGSQGAQIILPSGSTGILPGASGYFPVLGVAGSGSTGGLLGQSGSNLTDLSLQPSYAGIQQYVQAYSSPTQVDLKQRTIKKGSGSGSATNSNETNLFIYHLPPDFNDSDLLQIFLPFGTVLSAKVYIDKATGLSKCFGFVNYSDASSAQEAIRAMNGAAVGSKRLKVQFKKPKDKPY